MVDHIRELHKKWMEAELKNPELILQFCTDDIEFHTGENKIIKGKTQITAWIRATYTDNHLSEIKIHDLQIKGLGNLACLLASFQTTFLTNGLTQGTIYGKHFWMLKLINGKWLVDSVTWQAEDIPGIPAEK